MKLQYGLRTSNIAEKLLTIISKGYTFWNMESILNLMIPGLETIGT